VAGNVADQRPLLIKIEVNAGHGAGKPTEKIILERAEIYGFMAKALNLKWSD
jgi:prolyl oligopeptidase